jgi:flagellar biosynthesis protein FlhG
MADQASRLRELVRDRQPVVGAQRPSRSRILVITSGKGGVGKTNLTVNLALALARRGRRTILFDADMGMANVDVILNISPPYTISDVIAGRKALADILYPVETNLLVVPGGASAMSLRDPEGQIRVSARVEADGTPSIRLLDAEGNVTWSAP